MNTIAAAVTTAAPEIKAKHATMWALGDYPAVAHEVIALTGPRLVEAVGIQAGERVLDIAAGDGNAAVPAAERKRQAVVSSLPLARRIVPAIIRYSKRRHSSAPL